MIPRHRRATEMAVLAATRAGSADVRKLAGDIKKAQDPAGAIIASHITSQSAEIARMNTLLGAS